MRIELRVDFSGKPYIELIANKSYPHETAEEGLLQYFIREAKQNGLVIKNESCYETSDGYASIRLREVIK